MKIRDLRPGMGAHDKLSGRYIRIERIEIDGDTALIWQSCDGREAVPFPYGADDELEGIGP